MRAALLLSFLTLAINPTLAADKSESKTPGVAIGTTAPAFALLDQQGGSTDLNSLLKEGRMLAVVFHRSADW